MFGYFKSFFANLFVVCFQGSWRFLSIFNTRNLQLPVLFGGFEVVKGLQTKHF